MHLSLTIAAQHSMIKLFQRRFQTLKKSDHNITFHAAPHESGGTRALTEQSIQSSNS